MSTVSPTAVADVESTITWRDALTPLSRSSRRRWTIAFAALLLVAAGSVIAPETLGTGDDPPSPTLVGFVGLVIVFGMLRRGTRRMTAIDHGALDERDVAARDRAFRLAYPVFLLVTIAALLALLVVLPELDSTDLRPAIDLSEATWTLTGNALVGVVVWLFVWGVFLPTGMLAWIEPDAISLDEAPAPGAPELVRDLLVGVALAGSLALEIATDVGGWVLLLVGAIGALGGLARGFAGQPVMSRQRMWRVAIGLALLAATVVFALVNQ